MPNPSVKDRVTLMCRDMLAPAMTAAGFRRAGRVFWRNTPDVCHVIAVAMSPWGTRKQSSFTAQLGVFWHRVEEILDNPSVKKMPPPEHRCTFRIDLGHILSRPPKPWWTVTRSSDFNKIGRDVLNDLLTHGLPWLDYRSDMNHVLDLNRFMRPLGHGQYTTPELVLPSAQTVFKVMLGKKRQALADLKRLAANGYADDATKLARRLGLKTHARPRRR